MMTCPDGPEGWRDSDDYRRAIETYRQRNPHAYELGPQPLTPEQAALISEVDIKRLRGSMPDLTGGVDSVEYVRRMRDDEP